MKCTIKICKTEALLKRIFAIVSIGLFLLAAAFAASAIELRTAAQESAPKYYVAEDKSIQGLCPDIIHAIERIDPEIKFRGHDKFIPFKRLQHQLETGEIDVFFGFKKTTRRLETFRFIDIPLYQLNYKLAKLATATTENQGKDLFDDLRPGIKILTVKGSATAEFLKSENLADWVDDSPRSPKNMVLMLLQGRGDFAFYHDLGLSYVIKNLEAEQDVIILPRSYSSYSHYAAFSPDIPMSSVEQVKTALENLKNSGELDRIKRKYISR